MLSQNSELQPLNDTSAAGLPTSIELSSAELSIPCSIGDSEEIAPAADATNAAPATTRAPGSYVQALSDARIVRFNNRDLEKIQDELNALKAGGALARGTATPIVIRAELTSPQKVTTQPGTMTQTPAVAARQQVVVVQKPPPGNNVLASPKKVADVRVIHPPGVVSSAPRKVVTPTTSATAGGQVITKVIINPSGAGQFVSTAAGTAVQLVGTGAGGQPTLVLSSPTRQGVGTIKAGQQIVRVATPAGASPTKSMYVVSPVKTGGKVTMIPVSMAKSPQRIAPAPSSAVATLASSHRVVLVTAAVAATTSTSSTTTKAPSGGAAQVPKMNVLLRPATTQVVAAVTQGQGATAVATVMGTPTAGGAIQVPGSKFHYVRLVSAPTTAQGSTAVAGAGKVSTLIPVTTARALAPAVPSTSVASAAVTTQASVAAPVRVAVPITAASSTQQQAPGTTTTTTVAATQRVIIPASAVTTVSQVRTATSLSALPAGTVLSTGTGGMQSAFVVVPAQYVAQFQGGAQATATGTTSNIATRVVLQPTSNMLGASTGTATSVSTGSTSNFVPIAAAVPFTSSTTSVGTSSLHSEGVQHHQHHQTQHRGQQVNGTSGDDNSRPRKPCNCTKSQCLKLYCDCFANGEFCNSCNCSNCFNNLEHEEERQKAITACLDRNPNAFRPKIGCHTLTKSRQIGKGKEGDHERRHTKGCNCKKSGCLKNYCECYEAKILCTSICKCVGCKNFEDSSERKTLMQLADAAEVRVQQQAAARTKISTHDLPMRPPAISDTGERLPFTFITSEVAEATCQCLLAQLEEGGKADLSNADVERSVLEEFGRCLLTIIDSANKTKGMRVND